MQGLTSSDRARFTVVVPRGARVRYFVRDDARAVEVKAARRAGPASDFAVDRLNVDNLRPGVDFELIVAGADDGALWDRRVFRALDPAKARARLALISATDDARKAEADRIWPNVLAHEADVILLIGDNVYVDHGHTPGAAITPLPKTLWQRYVETRLNLPLYFAPRLVPTLATWDDHDYAYDNADQTYPYRAESRDTFLTFFPQAEPGPEFARGPGVASWWRGLGVEVGLTDNRFFRTVNRAAGPQSHFGAEQENWIVDNLARAERPIILVSGDQFFGTATGPESYAGDHPVSFAAQVARWRESVKVPLIFVSGDRHLAEIARVPTEHLGFPTFEITASGLHADLAADARGASVNPDRLTGVTGRPNYAIMEIMRAERELLRFSVTAFGPDAQLLFQRTLAVKR